MAKSGKLILRIPKSIHTQAEIIAALEGVSLNQWLASVVAMAVARSEFGAKALPQDRLQEIAVDSFCDLAECGTSEAWRSKCVACDAIYAAREALKARKPHQKKKGMR